jgi:uncharacterized membrane protein YkgB
MKIRLPYVLLFLLLLVTITIELLYIDFSSLKPYELIKLIMVISAFPLVLFMYFRRKEEI